MVRIAGLSVLLVLFAGLVFAQSQDDFVKVDKDGVTYFRVAPSGAATHTATDNTGPALTVTQNGTAPAAAFNGGKVGIGTSNPAQKLHIYGTADLGNAIHIDAQGATGAQQASLNFLTKGDGATGLQQATTKGWHLTARGDAWTTTTDRNDISLSFWDGTAWKTPIHIDSVSGNIGIGTTSPSQPLDLFGNMAFSGVGRRIVADFSNATHANRFAFQTSTANSYTLASVIPSGTGNIAGWTAYSTSDPNDASFFQMRVTDGATCAIDSRKAGTRQILPIVFQMDSVEKMRLTTDGMVGIGTSAPAGKLGVISPQGSGWDFGFSQESYPRAGSIYYESDSSGYGLSIGHKNPSTGAYSDYLYIIDGGNVGIGTTAPSFRLQLSTDSAAKPNGGSWSNPSDERLKKDVRAFEDGLETVKGIRPVYFRFNGLTGLPDDGKENIGVVAQEISKVAPYTVGTYKAKLNATDAEVTEFLCFNASALTFVLVNAVKELDVKNKDLRKENDELKKKVDDFESRLKAIEDKLGK